MLLVLISYLSILQFCPQQVGTMSQYTDQYDLLRHDFTLHISAQGTLGSTTCYEGYLRYHYVTKQRQFSRNMCLWLLEANTTCRRHVALNHLLRGSSRSQIPCAHSHEFIASDRTSCWVVYWCHLVVENCCVLNGSTRIHSVRPYRNSITTATVRTSCMITCHWIVIGEFR